MANLGTAGVNVIPTFKGIHSKIQKEFSSVLTGEAGKVGPKAGSEFTKGAAKEIGGSGKEFEKAARKSSKPMENEFGKSAKRAGGAFKGAFLASLKTLGPAVAALGIGSALAGSITKASDAEQSLGATEAIFKKHSDKIVGYSKEAAQKYGLSANSYREGANIIGSLFKNQGVSMDELATKTDAMIGLGADLAAQFGGTSADAVGALTAAFKGEYNALENYGVTLNETAVNAELAARGQDKLTGASLVAAKQQAITDLLFKQSKDSLGAAAREADTYAGAQARMSAAVENFQVDIGKHFLDALSSAMNYVTMTVIPTLQTFVAYFRDEIIPKIKDFAAAVREDLDPILQTIKDTFNNDILPALEDFSDWVVTNKDTLLTFTGTLLGLTAAYQALSIIGTVTTALKAFSIASAISTAWTWLQVTALNAQAVAAGLAFAPIYLIIGAIAALVAAIVYLWQNNETFRNAVLTVWEKIKEVVGNVVDWFQQSVAPAFVSFKDRVVEIFNNVVGAVISFKDRAVEVFNTVRDAVVGFYNNHFAPIVDGIRGWIEDTLMPMFGRFAEWMTFIWDMVSLPIRIAWGIIQIIFRAIQLFVTAVLVPAFIWLKDNVVTVFNVVVAAIGAFWNTHVYPILSAVINFIVTRVVGAFIFYRDLAITVFNAVRNAISAFWNTYVLPIFNKIVDFLRVTLGPIFNWLKDRITTAWNNIKSAISTTWTWINDNVFGPIKTAAEAVGAAFTAMKDTITEAWDKIKSAVKEPVRFVINTVINDGLIDGINGLMDTLGMKKSQHIGRVRLPAGFAQGGILPGMSRYTDGDSMLVPMRPGEGVYVSEAMRDPYERARLEAVNKAAMRGQDLSKFHGYAKGGLIKPFSGGYPQTSSYRSAARPTHNGVDFAMPVGTPLYATSDGTVSGAGWNLPGGTGLMLRLTTSMAGIMTRFHHLSRVLVSQGEAVKKGQKVALSGNTGRSTGPHLHYSVLRDGRDVNPMPYLNGAGSPGTGEGGGSWLDFITNPLEGLYNKAIGWFRDKFPAAGVIGDLITSAPKALFEGAVGFAWDKIKELSGFGELTANEAKLYDSGGILDTGLTTVLNRTGAPEAILNPQQWRDMSTLANRGAEASFPETVTLVDRDGTFLGKMTVIADERVMAGHRRTSRA